VLVTLTVCVATLPTATFPKLRMLTLGERTPAAEFAGFPVVDPPPDAAVVYPAQLDSAKLVRMMNEADTRATKLPPVPQSTL